MIVRISGEGQFELPDGRRPSASTSWTTARSSAAEQGDETGFRELWSQMLELVATAGTHLSEDELVESDVILPPRDISFAEAQGRVHRRRPDPGLIRRAGPGDVEALARTLARAFEDDPVDELAVPLGTPARATRRSFACGCGLCSSRRRCGPPTTTPARRMWTLPDRWRTTAARVRRPGFRRCPERWAVRMPLALYGLSKVEQLHPPEPHMYLAVLGHRPRPPRRGPRR